MSQEEVAALNNAETCIMCGACYSACTVTALNKKYIGPPALLNEAHAYKDLRNREVAANLEAQTAAFRGQRGGILKVVAAECGETITEMKLDYLPAFDGMAAAGGRLYLTLQSGAVVCLEGE